MPVTGEKWVQGFIWTDRVATGPEGVVEGNEADQGLKPQPKRRVPTWRIVLVLAAVVAAVTATVFLLSLPPPLTVREGATVGALLANFPTTNSATNLAQGNFTATTYANETNGPNSRVTLLVHVYGAAVGNNWVMQGVQMFYDVQVVGRFAPNLRIGALQLSFNETASGNTIELYNGPDTASSFYGEQGLEANVSADNQQEVYVSGNGSGGLAATLQNVGGPGPFYAFHYWANGQGYMGSLTPKFLEFRATVAGWMMPSISAEVGVEIKNVPRTFPLFPAGKSWSVYGLHETFWSVPTTATFTVTGALTASGPATGYLMNTTDYLAIATSGSPSGWQWTATLGTQPTLVNATLPPPGMWWYLVFTTPISGGAAQGANVSVTQTLVATT